MDNLLTRLTILSAQGASGIATRGDLSATVAQVANTGVKPGRLVYDPVTGQTVTVVGSATAYLTQEQIGAVENG